MFDEQIEAQAEVDFVIGELFFKLGEALLCVDRIKRKTSMPAMITMSFRESNVSEDGFTVAECARRLHDAGVDIVGLNCMNDPQRMLPHIREMRDSFDGYLAAQPVAFRCTDETPWFTGKPGLPRPPGAEPTDQVRAWGVRVDGEGHRRQLHRRLLRVQGDAHARDGEGPGQARATGQVEHARWHADERNGVQQRPPRDPDGMAFFSLRGPCIPCPGAKGPFRAALKRGYTRTGTERDARDRRSDSILRP